ERLPLALDQPAVATGKLIAGDEVVKRPDQIVLGVERNTPLREEIPVDLPDRLAHGRALPDLLEKGHGLRLEDLDDLAGGAFNLHARQEVSGKAPDVERVLGSK